MMLILSVSAMCSYLYPVCLVSQVLKNIYFREHLSEVASKYSICDTENETYTCMVYGPNGKGIMASLEYTLIIYSPNGKGMALWNIAFPSGNRHGKRKKDALKKI